MLTLSTTDLFSDEEFELYMKIVECINDINRESECPDHDPTIRLDKIAEKKECQKKLDELIAKHAGTPRTVSVKRITDTRKLERDEEGNVIWPEGITWKTVKLSRKIAEFCSEESRAMGLEDKDVTFDKIIIKWKSPDILKQIVLDGFNLPVLNADGTVENRHHIFVTASAGQLRRDKIQTMEENTWNRIAPRLMCGLTIDRINECGGINVNKLMAYIALCSSATEPWPEIDIDKCIVVDDFEAPVTGLVDNIDKDYNMTRMIKEVMIKHTDGIGMMLPKVSRKNAQIRGPWLKGLLTSFNFIQFCKVNGVPSVCKDIYGVEHDLEKEDIQVIFYKSQMKMAAYYSNFQEYRDLFHKYNCTINKTNEEEDYFEDKPINYQMLQTLTQMTDEEIEQFTQKAYTRLVNISRDSETMLDVLGADEESEIPYRRALAIYNELLRESYFRSMLKDTKTKMLLDAKSGKIKCENKRLFEIPDMYAACQRLFMGIENPEGLLKNGEVSCMKYRNRDEVDCLRSPHLALEHCIRKVVKDPTIYQWFYTDGIYTSCHDLITTVVMSDVDGDELNVVADPIILEAAKREIAFQDFVPYAYDANKAPNKEVDREEMFNGLKRAHDFGGIGTVSNSLTKIWNSDKEIDKNIVGCLCKLNNATIDGAKVGAVNGFENYPDLYKRFLKAIGGKRGKMPWFFQFSKNGRKDLHLPVAERKNYAKPNGSTMNRLCSVFDDIGNINMTRAKVAPFNWQMLLRDNNAKYYPEAVETFCTLDDGSVAMKIYSQEEDDDTKSQRFMFLSEYIAEELQIIAPLDVLYPSIVKYLFAGNGMNKAAHKLMFWRIFGDMACEILQENMQTYSVCENCGMKIPAWVSRHDCPKDIAGFFECIDCGAWCTRENSKQCRCKDCQITYRKDYIRMSRMNSYNPTVRGRYKKDTA